jgi:hypothetical protein
MTIQITGLTRRQRAIADVLWLMNTRADAERFIASLEPGTQQDALTVVEMMQLAIIDECNQVDDEVKQLIDKVRY